MSDIKPFPKQKMEPPPSSLRCECGGFDFYLALGGAKCRNPECGLVVIWNGRLWNYAAMLPDGTCIEVANAEKELP